MLFNVYEKNMKKLNNLINITTLLIINTLLICPGLFAQNILTEANQSRHMLSPIVHISNQIIQQGFDLNNLQLPLITPTLPNIESYSLEQLSKQIILQCESNNFSLLKINWQKKHTYYQQFIKETAAINSAINQLIKSKDISGKMNYSLFLEQACKARIDMLEHYQAPLSEKGRKSMLFISHSLKTIGILKLLMNPPAKWFKPLFNDKRKQALLKECVPPLTGSGIYDPSMATPRIIATWGCSTQCDHCDGATVIEIESFPWIWIKETQTLTPKHISRINLEPFHNDYFRDYYDFVYDKDASYIYALLSIKSASSSGFSPGTVGERALKRILRDSKVQTFQISFAPSVWMRSIIQKYGVQEYISYLKNIESIFHNAEKYNLLQYAIFNFQRIDDPSKDIEQIIKFCEKTGRAITDTTTHVIGRYYQLESKGEIDPFDTKSELYRFSPFANNKDVKNTHFIFSDYNRYFLLPDGQLIRGTHPNKKTIMRNYKQIAGVESIGQRKVSCLMCGQLDCAGKISKNCIGRKQYFSNLNLSATGGFSKAYLLFQSSI